MAPMTSAIGFAISQDKAEPTVEIRVGILETSPATFAMPDAKGEIAATTARIFIIVSICAGVSSPIRSSKPLSSPKTFSRTGVKTSRAFAPVSASLAEACAFSLSSASFVLLREVRVSPDRMRPMSSASCP